MYGTNNKATGVEGSRNGPSSSLILHQHLVSHYRHLQNVRSAVDTGQFTRHKAARQRSLYPLRLQESRTVDSDSTASLQLIDRILNDKHCPPQYYSTQLADLNHKRSEIAGSLQEVGRTTAMAFDALPTDDDSILKKIDSYLAAVREEERRQATRRRFNLSSSTGGQSSAPGTRANPGRRRPPPAAGVGQTLPHCLVAKHQFRPQILRTAVSPRLKYLRQYRGPTRVRQRPAAGSVSSSRSLSQRQPPESEPQPQPQPAPEPEPDQYGEDYFEDDTDEDEDTVSGAWVPPLSISPDSGPGDSGRQRAPQTTVGNRAVRALKTDNRAPSKDSAYNGGFSSCSRGPTPEEADVITALQTAPNFRYQPTAAPPTLGTSAYKTTFRLNDEQVYVQFLNEVTSDILARGIFTNRILKQVMAAHLERHRGVLDVERMQSELGRLREELGIPAEGGKDEAEYGYGSSGELALTSATAPCPSSSSSIGHTLAASSDVITGRSTTSTPALSVPAFVDSILFPSGGELQLEWAAAAAAAARPPHDRVDGKDGADAAPPGGPTVAPSGERSAAPPAEMSENVARLLDSLSLDESITRTIMRCYGEATAVDDDESITSDELHACLAGDVTPPSVT